MKTGSCSSSNRASTNSNVSLIQLLTKLENFPLNVECTNSKVRFLPFPRDATFVNFPFGECQSRELLAKIGNI